MDPYSRYKNLIRVLFGCFNRNFELSSKIAEETKRQGELKKLEGTYRRFQKEVELTYQPHEDVDLGLIRYYQIAAERQHRAILESNQPLRKTSAKPVNPWPKREVNYECNRHNRAKINFTSFITVKNSKKPGS